MTNPGSKEVEPALDQVCPWCKQPPEVHEKSDLGIRYLGCPTRGCVGRGLHFIIDHLWNTRVSADSAGAMDNGPSLFALKLLAKVADLYDHVDRPEQFVLLRQFGADGEQYDLTLALCREVRAFVNNNVAASPAVPRDEAAQDELVDEVQHRMDQVVEAAVEWHQAGREGGEWFEAAERLGAAINSLLELRDEPTAPLVSDCDPDG